MAVDLEALDAVLNSTTLALLGDTITYTPHGGSPLTLKAIADHGDEAGMMSGSRVVQGDWAIEVPVAVVEEPTRNDTVDLPQRPGEQFAPKEWARDDSGLNWLIVLKRKP